MFHPSEVKLVARLSLPLFPDTLLLLPMPLLNRSILAPRALRLLVLSSALMGAGAAVACGPEFTVKAAYPNEEQNFTLHALSGTSTQFSSAIALLVRQVTRVDGTLSFDIAFDLDANNDIVVLPVKMVGSGVGQPRQVGLKTGAPVAYGQILQAPTTGYRYDSVLVVKKGEAFIVQAATVSCANSITPYIYAKAIIDSVDTVERKLFGHAIVNLNCGFRGLDSGYPKN